MSLSNRRGMTVVHAPGLSKWSGQWKVWCKVCSSTVCLCVCTWKYAVSMHAKQATRSSLGACHTWYSENFRHHYNWLVKFRVLENYFCMQDNFGIASEAIRMANCYWNPTKILGAARVVPWAHLRSTRYFHSPVSKRKQNSVLKVKKSVSTCTLGPV